MAGHILKAIVVLGGKVDSTFNALSTAITELGTAAYDFLKECVDDYAEFEDVMMDASNAYKATFEGTTQEFTTGMQEMFDQAYEWAANSRFELMDVANAIASTAHAGKSMEETAGYMEAAMNLSLVGSMDLTTGLDMLIKTSNAMGLSFEEAVEFVDMWTYAANSSATNANEMGLAMEKLGGMMRMSDPSEILTLLSVMANMGTVGAEAGTMLKTTMLRIIAPSGMATEALSELGVTADDLSDAVGDDAEALQEVQDILATTGFSAYDDEGKLKSFIDIYTELYRALYAVDEEGAQLLTDAERNSILNTIFGTRGFVGISNIMAGLAEDENTLIDMDEKIEESAGYAEDAAETRLNDLKGKMTELENKIEVLKTKIGEQVAPELTDVLDWLMGIGDAVLALDDEKLNLFATALEGLIGVAATFATVGIVAKVLTAIATPLGMIAAGVVGFSAFLGVLSELKEQDFKDSFGSLILDETIMQQKLDSISASYITASEEMVQFKAALEESVTAYTTASGQLGGTLHALLITDASLTKEDVATIEGYVDDVIEATNNAITERTALDMATLNNMLAYGEWNDDDVGMFSNVLLTLNTGYEGLIETANNKSQELRNAITSAFEDGTLTSDEVENIMSIMEEMNALVNNTATRDMEAYALSLTGGTRLSIDNVFGYMEEFGNMEQSALQEYWNEALYLIDMLEYFKELAEKNGTWNDMTPAEIQTSIDEAYALAEKGAGQMMDKNDETMFGLFDEALKDAEWGDMVGSDYSWSGGFLSAGDYNDYLKVINSFVDYMGGYDDMFEQYKYLLSSGNMELAEKYGNVLSAYIIGDSETPAERAVKYKDFYDLYNNGATEFATSEEIEAANFMQFGVAWKDIGDGVYETSASINDIADTISDMTGMDASDVLASMAQYGYSATDNNGTQFTQGQYSLSDVERQSALGIDNINKVIDPFYNVWNDLGNGVYETTASMSELATSISELTGVDFSTVANAMESLGYGYGANGTTTFTESNGNTFPYMEQDYTALFSFDDGSVEAAAAGAKATVNSAFSGSVPISVAVTNATSAAQDALSIIKGYLSNVSVNVNYNVSGGATGYAEGGRATEASIFGEAGAEWAIPEQHTQRTKELLVSAAEASGFTWGELISARGGLGNGGTKTEVVYSPTIVTNDANGMKAALRDDKARFEKWWKERETREEVGAYA